MLATKRIDINDDINTTRRMLLDDLLLFTRVMFEARFGREFIISKCVSNDPHVVTICNALTDVFNLKTLRLAINCPPGWHKSELCKSFIAWSLARYPDCKFLYISHSFELAAMHTADIKRIMTMTIYKRLFGIEIRRDSSAKDFFQTQEGGTVAAFGAQGGITGHDAGLPGLYRFSGCSLIDDIHKPEEIYSDTSREKTDRNYYETIERRLRGPNVASVIIGQRLHEDDQFAKFYSERYGKKWESIIIQGLDAHDNARYPEVNPREQLILMRDKQPYIYCSQIQQEPIPAGGGLFKEDWFVLHDEMPNIIATFITADSAETDKQYNDATVFSFWGIYKIKIGDTDIEKYALHWLDCVEMWIEPKDLLDEFIYFWTRSMRFKVKPKLIAIEKKSTGVTLSSVLSTIQGLRIVPIERSSKSGSKSSRFVDMQQYIASGQISLPRYGKHTRMCIEHMKKITASNVHKLDDICDTAYDAIKMALIDKVIINMEESAADYKTISKGIMGSYDRLDRLKKAAYRR